MHAQLQNAQSQQTGRVNRKMDVGPHGKQHVAARRRPFHPHTLANIQTCSCTDTEEVWMRGIYTVTDNENRYLHKGLHLVSLRWQWWGEGWPVNMKRYTLSQCVRLAARRRNAVHTLSLGSKMNGCHRNRQWVSLGVRLGREMRVGWEGLRGGGVRTENEDWGSETAAY